MDNQGKVRSVVVLVLILSSTYINYLNFFGPTRQERADPVHDVH